MLKSWPVCCVEYGLEGLEVTGEDDPDFVSSGVGSLRLRMLSAKELRVFECLRAWNRLSVAEGEEGLLIVCLSEGFRTGGQRLVLGA